MIHFVQISGKGNDAMSIYTMTQTKEDREAFSKALAEASAKVLAEIRAEKAQGKIKPPANPRRGRFNNSNFGMGL